MGDTQPIAASGARPLEHDLGIHATANPEATLPVVDSEKRPSYEKRRESSDLNEKGDYINEKDASNVDVNVHHHDDDHYNPPPYDIRSGAPIPVYGEQEEETTQFTWRAIIVGCALGSIVQASNLYLGLKSGFTFGPSLFGAIFGFAIIKPLSRSRFFGGYFGPKENCTVQTAATASGGLGIIFVSGVPAMYQLGLLSTPDKDIGKLILFTLSCAFFGMAFAIPMRKHYILKQKLVFPTPTATALTIRSLHSGRHGEAVAAKKFKMLVYSFTFAIILKVASNYAPGCLWDWHVFWWISSWGGTSAVVVDNWGWFWENTPAFWGAGILSGVNASWSFLAGQFLAWAIIGPSLVATGRAFGSSPYDDYPEITYYTSMSKTFATANHPSARYWLLWVGVMIMVVASFTELACSGKNIGSGLSNGFRTTKASLAAHVGHFRGGEKPVYDPDADIDKVPLQDRVPAWLWGGTLLASVLITCLVMGLAFHVNVGLSIFAIILGYLFSFIGVQSAGDTDINPISTVAKASQLVIGGTTHGQADVQHSQKINLLAGIIAGAAAAQTTDMTGDLKTGHLLNAKPKNQFYAQAIGALCSVFLAPGLFVVFTKAYPCIINLDLSDTCSFGIPSVGAWRAVAVAVTTKGDLPIPRSSWITGIVLAFVGAVTIVIKNKFVPESKRHWIPNVNAIGLGFILPQTVYATAMAASSIVAWKWKNKYPANYDMYAFALAAGFMSGEGLGGIVAAILTIAGVDGSKYGSAAGCSANEFCG